jgi:hypothetical protein
MMSNEARDPQGLLASPMKVSVSEFAKVYSHIEWTKKAILNGRMPNEGHSKASLHMGRRIALYGIEYRRLSLDHLMAAIYTVNYISKIEDQEASPKALLMKQEMQRYLLEAFIALIKISLRRYRNKDTVEVKHKFWKTHVLIELILEWKIKITQ